MIYYSVLKSAPLKKRSAGAFAIISDVANAFLQDYQNEKNRDFQEHMLDRQQQYQNELNANSALVQRQSLERAGLNPNLMSGAPPYGTASVLGDSSSQQAPQVDPSVFNVIAQMKQQQPLIDAQVNKTNAETREIVERINNMREDTTGKQLLNEKLRFDNAHLNENWDLALREGLSRIGVNTSTEDLNFANVRGRNVETAWQEASFDDRLRELTENIELITSRKDLTDQQKLTEIAKAQEAYASASEKRASARQHDAQTRETIELLNPKKNKLLNESGLSEANQLLTLYKASIAESDSDWRDIEHFLHGVGLGANSVKAIVSALRKAHSAIMNR